MVDDLFEEAGDGAFLLRLHVQPGAGKTAVVGRHGDALKVKVAAPPEQGRANDACAALLASLFGVKAADVELVSGDSSRSKRFRLAGVERDHFEERLGIALDEALVGGAGSGSRGRRGERGAPRR